MICIKIPRGNELGLPVGQCYVRVSAYHLLTTNCGRIRLCGSYYGCKTPPAVTIRKWGGELITYQSWSYKAQVRVQVLRRGESASLGGRWREPGDLLSREVKGRCGLSLYW